MSWVLNTTDFDESHIQDNVGFTYIIINNLTKQRYIGKKLFHFNRTFQVKGKKKKRKVDSDWKTYYGSNKVLNDDVLRLGGDNFTRKILKLCKSKSELSYWETYYIFTTHALDPKSLFYNQWVSCRINKKNLTKVEFFLSK